MIVLVDIALIHSSAIKYGIQYVRLQRQHYDSDITQESSTFRESMASSCQPLQDNVPGQTE